MDPFLPTAMMDWHHLACIAREAWTMVRSVRGLTQPALVISLNAEDARPVPWSESLTEVHSRHEVLTSVEAAGIQGCTTSRQLYHEEGSC